MRGALCHKLGGCRQLRAVAKHSQTWPPKQRTLSTVTSNMPLKKKGKKGKKKSKKSKSDNNKPKEPMAPDYLPPPPRPMERLIDILKTKKVEHKELFGIKVSTRALEELTPQEIRDLQLVFEVFDMNNDGEIDAVEFRRCMKTLGFRISKIEARKMIAETGSQGTINFNEFLEFVIDSQGQSRDIKDEILNGFKLFDSDRTGMITLDNLKQACQDCGVKFTERELIGMLEEADTNGDGQVNQQEFIQVMLQTNLF